MRCGPPMPASYAILDTMRACGSANAISTLANSVLGRWVIRMEGRTLQTMLDFVSIVAGPVAPLEDAHLRAQFTGIAELQARAANFQVVSPPYGSGVQIDLHLARPKA